MKVILCDDVSALGVAGETKEVSNGYARNFLIPKQLALPATPSNLKKLESEIKNRKIKSTKDLGTAQNLASQIEKVNLNLAARAGREGHLFGSITNQMIADALKENGISVNKKSIIIESPIKSIGEYQLSVRLHPQVTVALKMKVTSDSSQNQESSAAGNAVEKSEETPVSS